MTDPTIILLFILTVLFIVSVVIILSLAQELKELEYSNQELVSQLHSHMTQNQIYLRKLKTSLQSTESLAEIYNQTPCCGQSNGKDLSSPNLETMACWAGKVDTLETSNAQSGSAKATSAN